MTSLHADLAAVRACWLDEIGPNRWWTRSAETDAAIAARFRAAWEAWRECPAADFLDSPADALGAVILFDQFPRNMFRGAGTAFATDPLALGVAAGAVERGFDQALDRDGRAFLYMPFMHSEDLARQDRSVALFEALGLPNNLEYARRHRDMIARHGRFPARNRALGRPDRPDEADAIAASRDW